METMRYPSNTPMTFSGARVFVEQNGVNVWCELCDTVMLGKRFHVTATARSLECLKRYRKPEQYLRAVLKAVVANYAERPEAYEHRAPVQTRGARMIEAKV